MASKSMRRNPRACQGNRCAGLARHHKLYDPNSNEGTLDEVRRTAMHNTMWPLRDTCARRLGAWSVLAWGLLR